MKKLVEVLFFLLLLIAGESQARLLDDESPSSSSGDTSSSSSEDANVEEEANYEEPPSGENYVSYHIWTSEEIKTQIDLWKTQYPDFFHLTSAQEKYGLPAAGTDADCPFHNVKGCHNFIYTIQDFITHPEGSDTSEHLPEVYWSGCLHGNERVGPTSVIKATELLLEAASCEALPRKNAHDHSDELKKAKNCRRALKEKGIGDVYRRWLARLVSTRRIVVTPTTNALGYYRSKREENGIDPNRDFPYDVTDPEDCMQTIAGRMVNEIFREHMFQLALTFHAGMEVVGYEWGAPTWLGHFSPDHTAQHAIGGAYSHYGGSFANTPAYKFGTMNDLVYYVRGGMEDWAYGGSWDPARVIPCEPKTFGGYDKEKTIYNNSTLRIFNMLVEASDVKAPKIHLGNSVDVLNSKSTGNGHISRNIRLALLAAELVEPYVSIFKVNELSLSDDIVPSEKHGERTCQKTKTVMVAKNAKEIDIEWTVGGSMTIDNTELWFAKWDDVSVDQLHCLKQPSSIDGFQKGIITGPTNGKGYFSDSGPIPSPTSAEQPNGPIFRGTITIPEGMNAMDQLVVIASAKVDQNWADMPDNYKPNVPPQSHIVNARTKPDWHHESAGKHVKGRLDWFSRPLTIVIGDFDESIGTQAGHLVNTVEVNPRVGNIDAGKGGGMLPKSAEQEQLWFPVELFYVLIGLLLCLACCLCFTSRCSRKDKGFTLADNDDDYSDEEFVFDAKPYSDSSNGDKGGVEMRNII